MFQERLFPHPELERLRRNSALPTIRVITFVENGAVETNHAFLRIAVGTNWSTTTRTAETATSPCACMFREGCPREGRGTPEDGMGFRKLAHHPGTGVAFDGFSLPFWEEARSLVETAATLFLPMRCIGWDVAITPSGPALIEANMWVAHPATSSPSTCPTGKGSRWRRS